MIVERKNKLYRHFGIILFLFSFCKLLGQDSLCYKAQELISVTIEMNLPCNYHVSKHNYDEGVFISYAYQDLSYITVFEGHMIELPLLHKKSGYIPQKTDTLSNKISAFGIKDNKYWREDSYNDIRVFYNNVSLEKKSIFDKVLDSFVIIFPTKNNSSESIFEQSYSYINSMLKDEIPLSFKDAVMSTEEAFNGEVFDIDKVNQNYRNLVHLAKGLIKTELITYTGEDKDIVVKHAAIFKVLTDTILIPIDSMLIYEHKPLTYDFEDPLGQSDWEKMFVTKLLKTRKGNCHSLPYLYKILADEFNIPCHLAFAPNHIYIKLFSEKSGWYNTELTSGTFPIDAWIIASGYVTIDAIRNGLYMDTLSNKQAVANCLVDLAQGYQHRYGKDNPEFVIKCCNKVLEYHPTNVNAILTKAEAQKHYIHSLMKAQNLKSPEALFTDENIKNIYDEMESLYIELHKSGYRRMPEEMYSEWLNLLRSEPDKFVDKKLNMVKINH